ncbi:hypothetical protein ABMA27_009574 [Loxostege sticticalis]|uniref:Integrase catalytic domain-containing protein n=1 Tax=Loxostege sticticalis TaxID=481309 RepID=A0ABR3H8E0_LOXSC
MASTLKELYVKRSSIKGQITKFKNNLNTLATKATLSSIEITSLSLKITKFESLATKFDDLQSEIEVLNSENLCLELDERESIECDFITNIATAKELLERQTQIDNEHRRNSVVINDTQCSFDHQDFGIKLPQILISKFDGAYFRWLEFRDTFENLIHKNNRLKNIQKFHYLLSYLEGDAARILSNFEVSSDNYEEAWKILCERYNNKRSLINQHLGSLFNIQKQNTESEKSLRFLVDHVSKNLRALTSLGQPTDKWDTLIIYLVASKLDSQTLLKWEEYRNTLEDMPTLTQFHKFLTDRADVLDSIHRNKFDGNQKYGQSNLRSNTNSQLKQERSSHTKSFTTTSEHKYSCIICNDGHKIYDCPIFKSKNIQERLVEVNKHNLCMNCLRHGHAVKDCRLGPCKTCKKRHNTLLHNPNPTVNNNLGQSEAVVNFSEHLSTQVILSTALIKVCNTSTGISQQARALLDCGSQSSFMTKSLKEKLGLHSTSINTLKIIGIGNSHSNNAAESCTVKIQSLCSPYNTKLSCLILNEITSELPKAPIHKQLLKIPKHIQLADPTFDHPAPVDVLIGADLFWDLLGNEESSLSPSGPKLRSSKLGWLISGPVNSRYNLNNPVHINQIQSNHATTNATVNDLDNSLAKFWELENIPTKSFLSNNEQACEDHFMAHTYRLKTGRFCVKLPLIDSPDCLGDTYSIARKRLINLEKKFKRNTTLQLEYKKFIQEYAELGHLSKSEVAKPYLNYFLCHHAVFKENSESTKLRVVFDGSAPSSSGLSLNNILMVGPTVQDSLFSILIRARQYKFLLTGDIEKMYRQVQVHEEDRDLQLILWRENDSQAIQTLRLNTLTYGTASASFLSTRCLYQIGEEQEDELIKTIIQKDFYVDDLITGCNDENQLRVIQNSVAKALSAGCFNLRKYKSNLPNLLESTNMNTQENLTISESSNTLGLGWSPSSDTLHFPIKCPSDTNKITKRFIMSSSFSIFDPLGILSPCIIIPKMLLQRLWQQKIEWDDPVPDEIQHEWQKFANGLHFLSKLQIPRSVLCDSPTRIELHTFSDASQTAYGACIYMRSIDADGKVTVRLLCGKSKVAPLKPTTMPRLELCAALLSARLCKTVIDSIRYKPNQVYHWCDSSIVLAWLSSDPRNLKSFVANRICEILETTKASSWRYVPTSVNPADLISRGVHSNQILDLNLWWSGPTYLLEPDTNWPVLNKNSSCETLPEIKSNSVTLLEDFIDFEKYSNLNKLQNTLAYIKRFVFNLKNSNNKRSGALTIEEINDSFQSLCIIAQRQSFPVEYEALSKERPLSSKSKILALSPFMDDNKLIRVGGRIDASQYTYEKKHPILLHSSNHLTKLIFQREHLRNFHAGPQLLLATVRETIWPVNGRYLARRTYNKCVRCRRIQGKTLCPKMGNLPSQRVTPDFPFLSVGLDFAGLFYILNRKGRGSRLIKCYLCVFICLRYKCIHLECVSDLSKESFVMTLKRFIARRGKPFEIFCDNGRNFVAAAKELGQFLQNNTEPLSYFANQEGIKFMFSPAYAPHFGGIFEAGVKSAKYHAKRVIGNSHLTFEEISTLFAQIESILNSRPLYPLSSSPNDLSSLTPGHFLIGRPLTSLPTRNLNDVKEHSLKRYARLEQIRQHFWSRWSKEYISELQQRSKWRKDTSRLNVGDLVLLQEENTPPLNWRLGRVTRLFPGADGIARVADIHTTRGSVRRPLIRLCPLPNNDDIEG